MQVEDASLAFVRFLQHAACISPECISLLKNEGDNLSSKQFLRALAFQLAKASAQKRYELSPNLFSATSEAAIRLRSDSSTTLLLSAHPGIKGYSDASSKNSRSKCDSCGRTVCPAHRQLIRSCKCNFGA